MRVPDGGKKSVLAGEIGQRVDGAEEPLADDPQRIAVLDQARVVSHERARGPEVDEAPGFGGDLAEMVHVGHDVVTQLALELRDSIEVDCVSRRAHCRDRRVGDLHAERPLLLRERDPQIAPDQGLAVGREDPRYVL